MHSVLNMGHAVTYQTAEDYDTSTQRDLQMNIATPPKDVNMYRPENELIAASEIAVGVSFC